jgi:hypothetical protein
MDKDTAKVVKEANRQGFVVTISRNGHVIVRCPDGGTCVTSGTPSDVRGFKNFTACLRGHGFIWPPPKGKGSGRGR